MNINVHLICRYPWNTISTVYPAKDAAEPEMLRVLLHFTMRRLRRCAGAAVSRDMDTGALSTESTKLRTDSGGELAAARPSSSNNHEILLLFTYI